MAIVNKPYAFTDNTAAEASEVNANFDTLYNDYNGGITAANLATDAVTTAKIANSNVTTAKIADNAVTVPKLDSELQNGWQAVSDSWTYASATTITVPSDATTKYSVGDKIKLVQSATTKYFYVTAVSSTVLTVTGGSDYTVANSAISGIYYSKAETPLGFPDWFNYTPSWTSDGTQPAIVNGTNAGRFSMRGKTVHVQIYWKAGSSTTFGTGNYFFALPIAAESSDTQNLTDTYLTLGVGRLQDTGSSLAAACFPEIQTSTTIQPVYYTSHVGAAASAVTATAPWTWANADRMGFSMTYQAD